MFEFLQARHVFVNVSDGHAIYGRDDVEPHYSKYVHELAQKDHRIQFMGSFQREKKQEVYQQIDVLVIPSITNETFSFVAREALESGIPVVASALGALTEIIQPEKNGFLFPSGNIVELSKILLKIAQNPMLLSELDCPGDIEIFSVDEHVAQLEKIYSQLV